MSLAVLLWIAWAAACTPVRGPLLHGKDLSAADSQFAGAPADAMVGYTPSPGSRRVLSEAEVLRLGARFGIVPVAHELCFEYAMEKLDPLLLQAAMEQALPGAAFEILDSSHSLAPEGRIVFAISSLPRPSQVHPDEPVIWRGYVEYSEGLKFMIWTKVRIAMSTPRVTLRRDLAAGQEISADDIEVKTVRGYPGSEHYLEKAEDAVGRRATRSLRVGAYLVSSSLQASDGRVVVRGDAVTVDVEAGATHLSVDARAESAGAIGETVKLRNPKSGKLFEARVTARGAASVIAPPIQKENE